MRVSQTQETWDIVTYDHNCIWQMWTPEHKPATRQRRFRWDLYGVCLQDGRLPNRPQAGAMIGF
jgi:hypothetical protein